jgi:hypothetical protein
MRDEIHEQVGSRFTPEIFDTQFPTWENLSSEIRHQKIIIARDELLKVLDRAGYRVTRKGKGDGAHGKE